MSMGTIGRMMKATRTRMIESEADRTAQQFSMRFGLRDGDYIRYRKIDSYWKHARLISVDAVWWNGAGGYTSEVTVAPLLAGGHLGTTRRLYLVVNANGTGLRMMSGEVERVSGDESA